METIQEGQSDGTMNTGNDHNKKSNSLINREKIDGTPFTLISEMEKGNYIVMGDFLMVEPQETKEKALQEMEYKFWDVILRMCSAVVARTLMEAARSKEEVEKNNGGI